MDTPALLTDLVELQMLQSCHALGMEGTAVFDVVVRALPATRNFLLAAGLEQALEDLAGLHFGDAELAWLEASGRFTPAFVRWLAGLRFSGDIDALPEGTVFFGGEHLLRVTAPLAEARLAASRLLNRTPLPILVASKAVRCVLAAQGREVIDLGLRGAHGADAALLGARACFIAGFGASATVLAGQRYGMPLAGTLAHALVQAHDGEEQAFAAAARSCTGGCTLPLDTYDVPRALARVVRLAAALRASGQGRIEAVQIGSGDLAAQARLARGVLDGAGLAEVRIVVSGDLDEYRIAALVGAGAPVDAFGVGARVIASADAPCLDCACELAEYAGRARRRRSAGRASRPGRKQIYRCHDDAGIIVHDTVGLECEPVQGRPLLEPVMRGGARVGPDWTLAHLRQTVRSSLASLPPALLGLGHANGVPVRTSPELDALVRQVDRDVS